MISVYQARYPPCNKSAKKWQIRQYSKNKISEGPSPARAASRSLARLLLSPTTLKATFRREL